MKKRYLVISLLLIFICVGCGMGNTPSAKVEAVLRRYTANADAVKIELGDFLNTLDLDNDNRNAYQDVYLRQYSDMTYEIKNERIDGNNAIVTVQIQVYDYYTTENVVNNYVSNNSSEFHDDNGVYSNVLAFRYRIDELKKVQDRIDYTIDFTLTKVGNEWVVDNLTNEQLQKIHGTYAH